MADPQPFSALFDPGQPPPTVAPVGLGMPGNVLPDQLFLTPEQIDAERQSRIDQALQQSAQAPVMQWSPPTMSTPPAPAAVPRVLRTEGDQTTIELPGGKRGTFSTAALARRYPEIGLRAESDAVPASEPAPSARVARQPPSVDLNAAAYVQPGQSQTSSQTSTTRTDFDPTAEIARVREANERAQSAAESAQVDALMAREEQAMLLEQRAEDVIQHQAKQAQIEQRRQAELEKHDAAIKAKLQQIGSGEIDPNHIWAVKGTGAKIGAAIAIAMGAYASAINGGPNVALQIVQSAIDRDMDAQKSNLGKRMAELGELRGLRNIAASDFDSEVERDNAALAMSWQAVKSKIDAYGVRLQGTESAARAAELSAAATMKVEEFSARSREAAAARIVSQTSTASTPSRVVTVGEQMGYDPRVNPETYVPAAGGNAPDAPTARRLNELAGTAESVVGRLRELQQIQQEGVASRLSPAKRARYKALAKGLVAELNVMRGQGAVSASDAEQIASQIPESPSWVFTSGDVAALQGTIDSVNGLVQSQFRNAVKPVQPDSIPAHARKRIRFDVGTLATPIDAVPR